jgi:hypothetical protein
MIAKYLLLFIFGAKITIANSGRSDTPKIEEKHL